MSIDPDSQNIFLAILQPPPMNERLQWDKGTLQACDTLARKHNVWMLFYSQLQRYLKEVGKDAAVEEHLAGNKAHYLQNIAFSIQQQVIEKKVLTLLASDNIPALVFKGRTLASDLYGDENSRTSCDIDVLIKIGDLEAADAILSGAGYSRTDQSPLGFLRYRLHHAVYRHDATGTVVEVHWNFSIPGFFNLSSAQIWQEVQETQYAEYQMSPEMTVIMLLMHHHIHAFKQLRNTLDLYWAFYALQNRLNLLDFAKKLKATGLLKTTVISINQIRNLCEEWEAVEGLAELHYELKGKGQVPDWLQKHFSINLASGEAGLSKKDRFLFRLALDKWTLVFLSFTKTFLPAPKVIKKLYSDKRNWRLPFYYLNFIRCRCSDWKS